MADEEAEGLRPEPKDSSPVDSAVAVAIAAADASEQPPEPDGGAAELPPDLPPDHPLLRRAQEALFQQLSATRLRLEEELHERRLALKAAKAAREQVGVELYGYQQHLAKLQLTLERNSEKFAEAAEGRKRAEDALRELRKTVAEEEALTERQEARVEKLQAELDRLGDTLRQIERYNEQVANEIAVTKRVAGATEGAVQALEKAKQEQDFLIDNLQQQLRRLARQAELHSAQLEAQRAETRAAQEFLARAVSDMEDVQFEKKQLVSQWRSSLAAMQRRDEALELIQDAIQQQQEQQAAIRVEMERYRKDVAKERQRNEARSAVLKKLEGQAQYLSTQIDKVKAKQAELQAERAMLQQELTAREAELSAAGQEGSKLAAQREDLDRQFVKTNQSIRDLEQQLLDRLAEQTSAEKSAQRTVHDTKATRAEIAKKEAQLQDLQGQLDKIQAEHDSTKVHSSQLAATLRELDKIISDRSSTISALEADMKKRNTEIEQKTRDIQALNRKLLQLEESKEEPETGPLEATINNIQREISAKTKEGRVLQRRWIVMQGQLVELQSENAELAECIMHMRAQQAVLQHKRQRLSQQLAQQEAGVAALGKTLAGLHSETARLNNLLAETTGLQTSLHEDNFLLETKITNQLKDLEEQWASLQSQIEALRAEKKEIVAAVVEAEKHVLVMERRIQLEREMQEAIDPHYGNAEAAALRKEISRLQHRYGSLLQEQERLVQEMEKMVLKRDLISMKGRASQNQKVQDMTLAQLKKNAQELQRSIAQAQREGQAVEGRLAALGEQVRALEATAAEARAACAELRAAQEGVRAEVEALGLEKLKALACTQAKQREAKRYEEAAAGKYKLHVADPSALAAELAKAQERRAKVVGLVQGLAEAQEELRPQLARALAQAGAA